MNRICIEHCYKLIFNTEQEAIDYMKIYHAGVEYAIYRCPEVKFHYHIRDKKKRNRRNRRKSRNRCVDTCTCLCHKGNGWMHPNKPCEGKIK